jgi:uncharacterized membrane protein (UPF0127 family)
MPGQAVVTIKEKQWICSVANTFTELATGLSGVESIQPQTGMLFDLGYDQKHIDIDMSQMLFPLDIIFINSTQGVVGVMNNIEPPLPATLDNEVLPGARFFLEVNAGEAEGIEVGDDVAIQGYAQPTQLDISSLMNFMLIMVAVVMIFKMVGRALEEPKERPQLSAATVGRGIAIMPKLPPEAYKDFLFCEYIRDMVRLGETITDEEARRMWEAWEKRYSPEPRSLLQTMGKTPYDKELEQLRRDLREGAISEEAYKRAVKEILAKKHKPYRSDVTVEAWQERDRLGIWITDNRTGETIAEWWDDDAKEMFEQGFFKPGVPLYSWEKPSREFVASVLDYAESVGLLTRGGSPSTVPQYLPQTSTATKLDSLQIVKAYKQVSRHGEDKISVSLQAWALFPRGRRPHFISMYRSGDDYVITPLYAHISEWVHVPVTKVRAWIKSLPVKHFEPMAVAPEFREEAERLAREVDEPMDIMPLPSMARKPAVIPTQPFPPSPKQELEFVSDSPEFLAYTIEDIGYREKLDTAFQTAIARAKGAR